MYMYMCRQTQNVGLDIQDCNRPDLLSGGEWYRDTLLYTSEFAHQRALSVQ